MKKFANTRMLASYRRPEELLDFYKQHGQYKGAMKRLAAFDPIRRDPDKFLYIRNRSISAGEFWSANSNWDYFSSSELAPGVPDLGFPTFPGKRVDIDHDPTKIIGTVLDSLYLLPMVARDAEAVRLAGKVPSLEPWAGYNSLKPGDQIVGAWIENVLAIDKALIEGFYPRSVEGILDGEITDTSMGTEIANSKCSICENVAENPEDFCEHIGAFGVNKGSLWQHPTLDFQVPSYEICQKISFFEDSIIFPESFNHSPGSEGADQSAKILQVFANTKTNKTAAEQLAFAENLRLVYVALSADKQAEFLNILATIT